MKSWIRTRKELLLLFFFFQQTKSHLCNEQFPAKYSPNYKSHHAMRHAAVAPETPDSYRKRPQCCTREVNFIHRLYQHENPRDSYLCSLLVVSYSKCARETVFIDLQADIRKMEEVSRSSRRHQWKRARRFHERWLFEGRMSSLLFTDDGCYSSFIQGLTSGRY